jgi:hypothetical protein
MTRFTKIDTTLPLPEIQNQVQHWLKLLERKVTWTKTSMKRLYFVGTKIDRLQTSSKKSSQIKQMIKQECEKYEDTFARHTIMFVSNVGKLVAKILRI